ncbi:hypothetical protein BJF80_07695 [Serinicoccus sp. CUA-874]|nr:hypothetical protein BJF80_07695 [Serinicoccus sp. CUA-874]
MAGQVAVETEHHDLGGTGVPADPDLGVQPPAAARVGAHDHEDAGRVLPGGLARDVNGLLRELLVDDDQQGQHPAHRHGPDLVAQPDEVLGDVRRAGAGQVQDHGSLHSRPSRRIISSEPAGPQVPAG